MCGVLLNSLVKIVNKFVFANIIFLLIRIICIAGAGVVSPEKGERERKISVKAMGNNELYGREWDKKGTP